MQKQNSNKQVVKETAYSKSGLVKSPLFTMVESDILKLVLKDDEQVTLNQARNAIKKFKEGI